MKWLRYCQAAAGSRAVVAPALVELHQLRMPLRLLRLARTANQILQLERVRLDIVELVVLNLVEIPIGEGCDLGVQEVVSGV